MNATTHRFLIVGMSALILGGCQTHNARYDVISEDCGLHTANAIGSYEDPDDACYARKAFFEASRQPAGKTVYWNNARTGDWGYYRPVRDGHSRFDGYYCREFIMATTMNGQMERVYGTACRQPNGTWRTVN